MRGENIIEIIWKEINGYKICNDGTIIGKRGKPLSIKPSKDGYVSTTIDLGKGYGVIHGRHRIIATVFIPNPENLPEVNHLDANKENNREDNLEWTTPKGNMEHVSENGLNPRSTACCLLNEKKTKILRVFQTTRNASYKTGEHYDCIGKSCRGVSNSAGGYIFRFYNEDGTWVKTKFDKDGYKWKSTLKKKIRCIETGQIFKSICSCAKEMSLGQSAVSDYINSKRKSPVKGYTFERLE